MEDELKKHKELIELVQTTDDVVKLDEEIDLLSQSLYHIEKNMFEDTLKKMVRIRIAEAIRKLILQYDISKKEDIKTLLLNAYKTICVMPVLQLTLAFEPSEAIIGDISRWARKSLAPGILLDLSLDRSILGGVAVVYKGRFYDLTLRKKLQSIFDKGELKLV